MKFTVQQQKLLNKGQRRKRQLASRSKRPLNNPAGSKLARQIDRRSFLMLGPNT
jgi:hypothetical protein